MLYEPAPPLPPAEVGPADGGPGSAAGILRSMARAGSAIMRIATRTALPWACVLGALSGSVVLAEIVCCNNAGYEPRPALGAFVLAQARAVLVTAAFGGALLAVALLLARHVLDWRDTLADPVGRVRLGVVLLSPVALVVPVSAWTICCLMHRGMASPFVGGSARPFPATMVWAVGIAGSRYVLWGLLLLWSMGTGVAVRNAGRGGRGYRRCERCGYDLAGLWASQCCPECGSDES